MSRKRVKVGRWFVTFGPGPRAWIFEFRPTGLWAWRHYWFSAHFGPLPDKPGVVRWRVGPLLFDRYRVGAAR